MAKCFGCPTIRIPGSSLGTRNDRLSGGAVDRDAGVQVEGGRGNLRALSAIMSSFFLGPLAAHPPFKESQVAALSSRAHHFDAMAFITGQVGLFRVADDALRIR
jgi:hypothetical protein